MVEFFQSIGQMLTNLFNFIPSTVATFKAIGDAVTNFFTSAGVIIAVLPGSVQVIIFTALGLLTAFIVIELLRDFL